MMTNSSLPTSQIQDAFSLESAGIREFFQLDLRNDSGTTLYLNPQNTAEFLGHTWESIPCKLSEVSQNSTGEQNRPKFSIANPQGVFSLWVEHGAVDGAILTRYRVLMSDLTSDTRAYSKNLWIVSKVLSLTKDLIVLELRSSIDGPNYQIPARSFFPPNFPHVSLR